MFSLVHVLLPFSDVAPAAAIRAALAPFERGGRGDVPDEWLAFHDETEHVRALHAAEFVVTIGLGGGTRIEGGDAHYLDIDAVRAAMTERGDRSLCRAALRRRARALGVRLQVRARPGTASGHGRLRSMAEPARALGLMDLGGRFDGRIVGGRRRASRTASVVSSGPSRGRSLLAHVRDALAGSLGSEQPAEVVVEADDNIELISRLLEDARAGRDHAFPGAVLLPPGMVDDGSRWLRSWPEIGPAAALDRLGLPASSDWKRIIVAAYERFPDHWAAGVAYHL